MLLCKKNNYIHKSAIEKIASHKGADNGRSTMKGGGYGAM
jgi:hypothetical protein